MEKIVRSKPVLSFPAAIRLLLVVLIMASHQIVAFTGDHFSDMENDKALMFLQEAFTNATSKSMPRAKAFP